MTLSKGKFIAAFAAVVLLIASPDTFAQPTQYNPLVQNGEGVGNSILNARQRGLAGISTVGSDNNLTNFGNPASIADILNFNVAAGVEYVSDRYDVTHSRGSSFGNQSLNPSYLVVTFNLNKSRGIGLQLGISSLGSESYQSKSELQGLTSTYGINNNLSKFSVATSYRPLKNLALGIGGAYKFGGRTISRTGELPVDLDAFNVIDRQIESRIGFVGNAGLLYTKNFDSSKLQIGLDYELAHRILNRTSREIFTLGQGYSVSDSVRRGVGVDYRSDLGSTLNFGAAYTFKGRLNILAEYSLRNNTSTSTLSNRVAGISSGQIKLGLQWTPDSSDRKHYFNLVQYRAGFAFGNLPYTYNGANIQEMKATLGVGLPLLFTSLKYAEFSMMDVFVEYSRWSGALDMESVRVGAGILLSEPNWFYKRKLE